MTNAQVIECFLREEAAQHGHLTSTGEMLYSYGLGIAGWLNGGGVQVWGEGPSRTTNRHRNLVESMARAAGVLVARIGTPFDEKIGGYRL